MKMKRSLLILGLFYLVPQFFWAQEPEWVLSYQQGVIGEIADSRFYLGIGESTLSQEDADEKARIEFAKSVETRVSSSFEEQYLQSKDSEESKIEVSTEIKTDLSLKGITITHRYYDSKRLVYYSMIKVDRQEYLITLQQNIQEELLQGAADLDRQRLELEQQNHQREEDRLAKEQELELERLEQEAEKLEQEEKLQRERMKIQRREDQLIRYADYLERRPYPRLISFDNALVYSRRHTLSTSYSLSNYFLPRSIEYNLSFGELLQLGTSHVLDFSQGFSTAMRYSDLDAKIALLNNNGRLLKVSAALGARGFISYSSEDIMESSVSGTLYGALTLAVPQFYYNDISLYVGLDKISLGTAWYPLYNVIGDSLGLMAEVYYVYNEDLQYSLQNRPLNLQLGLLFLPNEFFCARLNWEDNLSTFVLAVDVSFGKGRK